jgi:hypothetical protein
VYCIENQIAKEAYDHATHFIYDIHGNVTKLMQDNKKMSEELFSFRPLKNKHA